MSESNNKKKKSRIAILILVYSIIAILITTYLILFYKKNNVDALKYYSYKIFGEKVIDSDTDDIDLVEKIKLIDDEEVNIDRVSLSDRYALNNLTFNEIIEHKGDIINISDDGNEEYFIRIKYYEIEGLKNKKIQDKINNDIKKHVYEKLDEVNKYINETDKEKINDIYIDTYIVGNYSDVLSIDINKFISLNIDENDCDTLSYIQDNLYLNYRLDTGEYLKFEDCFTKDANIKQMLIQNYYSDRAWQYRDHYLDENDPESQDYYIDEFDMDKRDYGEIEDDLLKLALEYEKNKDNIIFGIEERYLSCIFKDYYITIPMYDNYEYIDIAKKFISKESLYEDGNLEKANYIYSFPIHDRALYYDFLSNNKFLSVIETNKLWKDEYKINKVEEDNDFYDIDYEEVNRLIEKIKEYLIQNENTDNDVGYIYYVNVYQDYRYNDAFKEYRQDDTYYFSINRIEIEYNNFKEKVQEINYSILQNISEGYIGITNLGHEKLLEYNYVSYDIKEDAEGNLQIENYYDFAEHVDEYVE